MTDDEVYGLLRNLASPVVAITSRRDDETNGMIANSAIRASLVPECPRVAFYCFKNHYSHEIITDSGTFCLHLLHRGQFDVIRALGFESGRDHDKLQALPHRFSERGLPVLEDTLFHLECTVVNSMDAGPSTFFMGDLVDAGSHPDFGELTPMDSHYFRNNMPDEWKDDYETNRRRAQEWARDHLEVDPEKNGPN